MMDIIRIELIRIYKIFKNITMDMLLNKQTFNLEMYLAIQSLCWGLWLILPFASFTLYSKDYTIIEYLPENLWGIIFTLQGSLHIYSIVKRDVNLCRYFALILGFLWLIVLISFFIATPLDSSIIIYVTSIIGCIWVYIRLRLRFT